MMSDLRKAAQQALETLKYTYEVLGLMAKGKEAMAALEAALAQPEQEPAAWLYEAGNDRTLHWYKPPLYGTPLYTAPQQREWIDLTDEEELMIGVATGMPGVAIRMIEAKLKEKNA